MVFLPDTFLQTSKTYSFDENADGNLLCKEEILKFENNRMLLEHRPMRVSAFFRLLTAAILATNVPLYWVALWLVLVFGSNVWLLHYIDVYDKLLAGSGDQKVSTPEMLTVVQQFKRVWYLNAVIWGLSCLLAQIWLPDIPRVLSFTVMGCVMYLFLTRNCADRKLMHGISAILLLSGLFSGLFRLYSNWETPLALRYFLGLSFYTALNGYLIYIVGERFYTMFQQRIASEFAKLQLIESLEKTQIELRLEQEALKGANSVIQQFYSAAAHDLRQPVYAMEIYTEMLKDEPSRLPTLLPKISQSCVSINTMFNDLFDFQQKHLGDLELSVSKLNIAETLDHLALHFEPLASAKNLKIRFKSIDGYVNIIPLYSIRVLSNLIANAIRYTPSGRILVGVRKSKTFLSFEVWDTGIGIEKEAQERIFTEFYKVDNTKENKENLGLGLSIVKQLAQRIEGASIYVHSRMNHGTVFKLQVPIQNYSAS